MLDAVVVSDVHCDGPDSPTQAAFLRFLGGLRTRRLVLAGDIFHAFWCPASAPFAAYRPVLDALSEFDLSVLPGNHDWALGRWFAPAAAVAVGTRLNLRLGDLAAEVSHGDEVDERPRYRVFHRALRSGAFGWTLDRLGERGAWALLHKLAGTLGDGAPNPLLVERQQRLAGERLAGEADLVVMGHTHQPTCMALPGGIFLNPGDWVRHRTWGAIAGGRVELRRFED